MLKSRLGLFAVVAVTVGAFALIAVKNNTAGPGRLARASAAPAASQGKSAPSTTTQPTTNPASSSEKPPSKKERDEAAVMAWLRSDRPRYHRQMLELKKTDPEVYWTRMPRLLTIMRQQQIMSPQERKATNEEREKQVMVAQIAGRMRRVPDGPARNELEKQLRQAISIHFDSQQALREIRLNDLEARIDELREELERTRKQRQETITKRLSMWLKAARPLTAKVSTAK